MDQKQETLKVLHEAAKERLRATDVELDAFRTFFDQLRRIKLRILDQIENGDPISPEDVLLVLCAEPVLVKELRDASEKWQEASTEVNRLLDERIRAAH
ncbi:MAG: hypothetical protein WD733_00225 [Bryobacterales bacterium]